MKTMLFLGVLFTFTRCIEPKYERVEEHNKHYHQDWSQITPYPLDHFHGYSEKWNHNHDGEQNRDDGK